MRRGLPPAQDIVRQSNSLWRHLYFDDVEEAVGYQVTRCDCGDRLFYNAAQCLTRADPETLENIEARFQEWNRNPCVYWDPDAPSGLEPALIARGYREVPEEAEHWYGLELAGRSWPEPGHPLRLPPGEARLHLFTPEPGGALEDFLAVDAQSNGLPDAVRNQLRDRLLQSDSLVTLAVLYWNARPVATRALGIVGSLAFGAEGATLPAFRRSGCYRALSFALLRQERVQHCTGFFVNCDREAYSNQAALAFGMEHLFTRRLYVLQKV